MTDFDFEPKRMLKAKNHLTINEGKQFQETVQHLEKNGDTFTEISREKAARKYGSRKLVREINFQDRDGLKIKEKDAGLNNTPDWFQSVMDAIDWDAYDTFLYELDHLHMAMFFVRELYGDTGKGREQIIQLTSTSNGIGLDVVCQLDYDTETDNEGEEIHGFIKVSINESKPANNFTGLDINVEFKHSFFEDEAKPAALREILTGICLKHGYTDKKMMFNAVENSEEVGVKLLDKDFVLWFDESGRLDRQISPWVAAMFAEDGCPLDMDYTEVAEHG